VLDFLELLTSRADATRVSVGRILAVEVLRVSDGELEFAHALLTRKELCVGHTTLLSGENELSFDIFLSYDIAKSHTINRLLTAVFILRRAKIRKI